MAKTTKVFAAKKLSEQLVTGVTQPDGLVYGDGCEYADSCFKCPLPACKHDVNTPGPASNRLRNKRIRDAAVKVRQTLSRRHKIRQLT